MEELVIGKDLSWMDAYPSVHEPKAEYISSKIKKDVPAKPSNQRAKPSG